MATVTLFVAIFNLFTGLLQSSGFMDSDDGAQRPLNRAPVRRPECYRNASARAIGLLLVEGTPPR